MGSLWNRSGTIERLGDDVVAAGAQAFFFVGGTTTPFTVYQDAAESSAHPHPLLANAHGRWPDVFVPYTVSYDVQVKSSGGEQLTYTLQIPNPDPVDLSITIPAENQVQTGMIHAELINTTKAGYVRLNGKTIGSTASGALATERANDDTLNLYTYLWNNLPNSIAPVAGGRGGSAASDFASPSKVMTLPDCRGAGFIGLDDMGNTAAAAFTGLTFITGNATTAGSYLGVNRFMISTAMLPAHTHPSGTSSTDGAHTHTVTTTTGEGTHAHDTVVSFGTVYGQPAVYVGGSLDFNNPALGWLHVHRGVHNIAASNGTFGGGAIRIATFGSNAADDSNQITGVQEGYPGYTADHKHAINLQGTFTTKITSTTNLGGHTHTFTTPAGTSPDEIGKHSHTFDVGTTAAATEAVNNLPLTRLVTWYIKL